MLLRLGNMVCNAQPQGHRYQEAARVLRRARLFLAPRACPVQWQAASFLSLPFTSCMAIPCASDKTGTRHAALHILTSLQKAFGERGPVLVCNNKKYATLRPCNGPSPFERGRRATGLANWFTDLFGRPPFVLTFISLASALRANNISF